MIASHLHRRIGSAVLNTVGADLSLGGTVTAVSQSKNTVSLSVSNAEPLAAAGTMITSVLPSGVTLVAASSSKGCTHNGSTLSCIVGSVTAGGNALVTVGFYLRITEIAA